MINLRDSDALSVGSWKAACWRLVNMSGGLAGCHMKETLYTDPGGKSDAHAVVCVPNQ